LATADTAGDSREDSHIITATISAVLVYPKLTVLVLKLVFTKGVHVGTRLFQHRGGLVAGKKTVGTGINGVSFCPHSFSDLDFSNVIALLAKLLELLVPALESMASEAAYLSGSRRQQAMAAERINNQQSQF